MIIVCPECSSKFAVPASAIPEQGRRVKCSDCAHMWHQEPLHKAADLSIVSGAPITVDEIEEGSELPVAFKAKPIPVSANTKTNAFLMLIFAAIFGFFTHQDAVEEKAHFTRGIYKALKLHKTKNIVFNDVEANVSETGNKLSIEFSGRLKNTSYDRDRDLEPLEIIVLSAGGHTMGNIEYNSYLRDKEVLNQQDSIAVGTKVNGVSGNVKSMEIHYGNWLERMFF